MWDNPFDRHIQHYADTSLDYPITQDRWKTIGPALRGSLNTPIPLNTVYPVENDQGMRGFQKYFSASRAATAPPMRRLAAELIAAKLAHLGEFPVAPNFLALKGENFCEENSLISIVPFKNGCTLDRLGEKLPHDKQIELLEFFSRMLPFYQWLQLGDFNPGAIVHDREGKNAINSRFVAIDFEDCGIAKWLEQDKKGEPITHGDLSRARVAKNIEKILQKFCPDVAPSANGFFNSDGLRYSLATIENIPTFETFRTLSDIPEDILPAEDPAFVAVLLDARKDLLRPMFFEPVRIVADGAERLQPPVATLGTPALNRAIASGFAQTPSLRKAITDRYRAVAGKITKAVEREDYGAAADCYMGEYNRIRHSKTFATGFSMLSQCLIDRNVAIFPNSFNAAGEVAQLFFIRPSTTRSDHIPRLFEPVLFDLEKRERVSVEPRQVEEDLFDRCWDGIMGRSLPANSQTADAPHIARPVLRLDMLKFG